MNTREHAQKVQSDKVRITKLQAADIGAYAREVGVLPRYLVGGQIKPHHPRIWRTGSKELVR